MTGRAHGRHARRRRDDRGSGLIELVWLGLILLVPLVYVVLSVFTVQRTAFATISAARAAGRAYVLAPTDAVGLAQARAAARQAYADQGLPAGALAIAVTCTPTPRCHQGGSLVTVVVSSTAELPLLPPVLGGDVPGVALEARFMAPVGQYQAVTGAG